MTGRQARSLNFYFGRIPEIVASHGSQKWEIFASVPSGCFEAPHSCQAFCHSHHIVEDCKSATPGQSSSRDITRLPSQPH